MTCLKMPHNKALQLTANPLRGLTAAELVVSPQNDLIRTVGHDHDTRSSQVHAHRPCDRVGWLAWRACCFIVQGVIQGVRSCFLYQAGFANRLTVA